MDPLISQPFARLGLSWFYFFLGLEYGNWVARIPDIKSNNNLSDGILGLLLLSAVFGAICSLPLVSYLNNNIGTSNAVFIGAILCSLLIPIIGIIGNMWILVLGITCLGFSMGILDISSSSHAVLLEKITKEKMIGSLQATFSFGSFFGVIFGGFLAGYGITPFYDFIIVGVWGVLFSLLSYPFLIQYEEEMASNKNTIHIQNSPTYNSIEFGRLKDDAEVQIADNVNVEDEDSSGINSQLIIFCSIGFIAFLGVGCVNDWSTIYFNGTLYTSGIITSSGYALFQVFIAMGQLLSDHLVIVFGSKTMLKLSGVLSFLGLLVVVLAPSFILPTQVFVASIGLAISGAGLSSTNPIIIASAGNLRIKGMTTPDIVGVISTFTYVGLLVGPPMFGGIAQFSGELRWSFLVAAFLMLGISVLAYIVHDKSMIHVKSTKNILTDE